MSIDAEVMLTERDLFEGTRAMPEQRVARWTPVIVVVAMLVAFSHEPEILVMTLLVVPMLLVTRSLALRFIVRRQYRAMPEAGRKIEFQFREDGFMMKTSLSRSNVKYEALHRFVFAPHTLLLYTSTRIAQVVPRRAFNADQLAQIRSWLEAKVPPTPKRLHPAVKVVGLWLVLIVSFLFIWQWLSPAKSMRSPDSPGGPMPESLGEE
jgi:hypothetical protein